MKVHKVYSKMWVCRHFQLIRLETQIISSNQNQLHFSYVIKEGYFEISFPSRHEILKKNIINSFSFINLNIKWSHEYIKKKLINLME